MGPNDYEIMNPGIERPPKRSVHVQGLIYLAMFFGFVIGVIVVVVAAVLLLHYVPEWIVLTGSGTITVGIMWWALR